MPRYEIVDARAADCGQMARKLRGEQRVALLHANLNPHRELRRCFDQSAFRKAWRADGNLIGLGGVTGTTAESEGVIWLAFSEEAIHHKKTLVRTANAQIREIMQLKRKLYTSIITQDKTAFNFARYLGFVLTDIKAERFGTVIMLLSEHKPELLWA